MTNERYLVAKPEETLSSIAVRALSIGTIATGLKVLGEVYIPGMKIGSSSPVEFGIGMALGTGFYYGAKTLYGKRKRVK